MQRPSSRPRTTVFATLAAAFALAGCGGAGEAHGAGGADVPSAFAKCQACHSLEPGRHGIGPSLAGVHGSPAAHVGDYAYSSAMRQAGRDGLVWDAEALDAYLANPRAVVPGTSMSFAGLRDEAARAELVEWLEGV